ncbi:hypothetical protein ES703_05319 [subsurface metagenome]
MDLLENIRKSIIGMDEEKVLEFTKQALAEGVTPEKLLGEALNPAMEVVGQEFEKGNIFFPEMLMAAETLRGPMKLLRPILAKSGVPGIGKVVIGTVKGDVHDIGKSIVCMMLEGTGFEVHDLGVDVPAERFVEKVADILLYNKEEEPNVVGMSAFLTTTGLYFQEVIEALRGAGLREQVKVIIGGAAASTQYAEMIGADGYGANAGAAVRLVKSLVGK